MVFQEAFVFIGLRYGVSYYKNQAKFKYNAIFTTGANEMVITPNTETHLLMVSITKQRNPIFNNKTLNEILQMWVKLSHELVVYFSMVLETN